jgi:phage terminase large subunit-like protein
VYGSSPILDTVSSGSLAFYQALQIFVLAHAGSRAGCSHNSDGVVVEDCGHVFRRELVRGVTDEETCLADRTVADDDAPARASCQPNALRRPGRGAARKGART